MNLAKINRKYLAVVLLAATISVGYALGQGNGETKTVEGVITDIMCGVKHTMMKDLSDQKCAIECVKMGSKYGLLVNDKVFTLEGGKQSDLEKLAGKKAKVTGAVEGTTLRITAVSASY